MYTEIYESYDIQELLELIKDKKPDIFEKYTRINPVNLKTIHVIKLYFLKGE